MSSNSYLHSGHQMRADVLARKTLRDIFLPLVYGYCRTSQVNGVQAAEFSEIVIGHATRNVQRYGCSSESRDAIDWLFDLLRNEICRFNSSNQFRSHGQKLSVAIDRQSWRKYFRRNVASLLFPRIREHFEAIACQTFELIWIQRASAISVSQRLDLPIESVYRISAAIHDWIESEANRIQILNKSWAPDHG